MNFTNASDCSEIGELGGSDVDFIDESASDVGIERERECELTAPGSGTPWTSAADAELTRLIEAINGPISLN